MTTTLPSDVRTSDDEGLSSPILAKSRASRRRNRFSSPFCVCVCVGDRVRRKKGDAAQYHEQSPRRCEVRRESAGIRTVEEPHLGKELVAALGLVRLPPCVSLGGWLFRNPALRQRHERDSAATPSHARATFAPKPRQPSLARARFLKVSAGDRPRLWCINGVVSSTVTLVLFEQNL